MSDVDRALAALRAALDGLRVDPVHDDVIETEVAMRVSAQAQALVGEQVTLLTEAGVVTGTLLDYDVSPARLVGEVLHVDLAMRIQPGLQDVVVVVTGGVS